MGSSWVRVWFAGFFIVNGSASAADLVKVLKGDGRFGSFVAGLEAASAEGSLETSGEPVTVFAPSDEAFRRLPDGFHKTLLVPGNEDQLEAVLGLHVVPGGAYRSTAIPVEMRTVSGARLVVTYTRGALTLRPAQKDGTVDAEAVLASRAANEARVVTGDIQADNALIHVIDAVLLPPDLEDLEVLRPRVEDSDDRLATTDPGETGMGDQPNAFVGAIAEVDGDGNRDSAALTQTTIPAEPSVTILPAEPQRSPTPAGDDANVVVLPPPGEPNVVITEDKTEPVVARERPEATQTDRADPEAAEVRERQRAPEQQIEETARFDLARPVISLSELLGREVRYADGEQLGEVDDVLLSLETGRAETVVVAMDPGLLGLFDKTVQVSAEAISIDPLDGTVIVDRAALDLTSE